LQRQYEHNAVQIWLDVHLLSADLLKEDP